MMIESTAQPRAALQVPSAASAAKLFVGGFAGLMAWELWARGITPLFLGGPLEPAGLVQSLARTWLNYDLPRLPAEAIHYAIGIVGYPVAYLVISRALPRWPVVLDVAVWALFTAWMAWALVSGRVDGGIAAFWAIVTAVTATRLFNRNALVADCLSWGSFTWFNALGIMAPLAGLPFLLMEWGGGLSFMSYVGHVIYGFIAAYVFEVWSRRG